MAGTKKKVEWALWATDPTKWGFFAFTGVSIATGLGYFAAPAVLLAASPFLAPIVMAAVFGTGVMLFAHVVYSLAMGNKNGFDPGARDNPLFIDVNDPKPLNPGPDVDPVANGFLDSLSTWEQRYDKRFEEATSLSGQFKTWMSQPVNYVTIAAVLLTVVMMTLAICWAVDPALLGHGLNAFFDFVATTLSGLFANSGMFALVPGSVANQIAVTLVTAFSGLVVLSAGKNFGEWVHQKVTDNSVADPIKPNTKIDQNHNQIQQQPDPTAVQQPAQPPKPEKIVPQIITEDKNAHNPLFAPAGKLTPQEIVENVLRVIRNTNGLIRVVANFDHELKVLKNPDDPTVKKGGKIGASITNFDKTQKYVLVDEKSRKFDWQPSEPKKPRVGPRTYSELTSTSLLTGAASPLKAGMVASFTGHGHDSDNVPFGLLYDVSKCVKPRSFMCDGHTVTHPHRKRADGTTARDENIHAYENGFVPNVKLLQDFVNSRDSFVYGSNVKQLTQTEVLTHIPQEAFMGLAFRSEGMFLYGNKEGMTGLKNHCHLLGIPQEQMENVRLNSPERLGLCVRLICDKIRMERELKRDFLPIMVVHARVKDAEPYAYSQEEQRRDMLLFLNHPELKYPDHVNLTRQYIPSTSELRPCTTVTTDVTLEQIMTHFGINDNELTQAKNLTA